MRQTFLHLSIIYSTVFKNIRTEKYDFFRWDYAKTGVVYFMTYKGTLEERTCNFIWWRDGYYGKLSRVYFLLKKNFIVILNIENKNALFMRWPPSIHHYLIPFPLIFSFIVFYLSHSVLYSLFLFRRSSVTKSLFTICFRLREHSKGYTRFNSLIYIIISSSFSL